MLDLLRIDIVGHSELVAHITEITMAASLFITGLKLRLPLKAHAWRVGLRLAFPAMLLTVGGMACLVHWITGFNWPLSLAFGAIVAPTDPVLASLISVNDARDDDALRVALSSEAGMNDGSALPLLILALLLMRPEGFDLASLGEWATLDVLWSIGGGIAIGYLLGRVIGQRAARTTMWRQTIFSRWRLLRSAMPPRRRWMPPASWQPLLQASACGALNCASRAVFRWKICRRRSSICRLKSW